MPIYEYACRKCGHQFEAIVQSSTRPECPSCDSQDLHKQLSVFAVGKQATPTVDCGQGACGACPGAAAEGACPLN